MHKGSVVGASVMASLFLAGCGGLVPQPYLAPTGGEVAFLRVVEAGTRSFPAKTSVTTFTKAETCEGRLWLYNDFKPGEGQAPAMINGFARIESGKPFSVTVSTTTGSSSSVSGGVSTGSVQVAQTTTFCAPVVTFVPQAGRYYLAERSHAGSQCSLLLYSAADASMANARPEPVKRMTFTRGFDESSSWCKPPE